MVQFEFVIVEWAAFASGLRTPEEWTAWACADEAVWPAPKAEPAPALSEMPAMMRRRVDRLGRLACQVSYWCQNRPSGMPLVFASRYGDAARSLSLLGDLVQGQPLSPAGFALSVHNAIAALYSIARGDTAQAVVVAGGRATVEAALVEAAGLLGDGAEQVMVVMYEAGLPQPYDTFQDEVPSEYAWAWRLARADVPAVPLAGSRRVRLELGASTRAPSGSEGLPSGLAVLRQVLRQQPGRDGAEGPLRRPLRTGAEALWSAAHA